MKILHICHNVTQGGAARAAFRQHLALSKAGYDSTVLVLQDDQKRPHIQIQQHDFDFFTRLCRRWRHEKILRAFNRYKSSRPTGYDVFSDDRSKHGQDMLKRLPDVDVVNLHWVAGFVDYPSFFPSVCKRTPVVWSLYDMNPFTGGCHYDFGCGKYLTGCGSCPQLGSTQDADLSAEIWKRKQEAFSQIEPERLHLVPQNRWMADQLKASPLLRNFPATIVPSGLDTVEFSPRSKQCARDVLRIPQEGKVILFVSDSLENRRKGLSVLEEALAGLTDVANLFLLCVGFGKPATNGISSMGGISYLNLGRITNDHILSFIYSAANVFVIPSLQDNMPNTVLEALACGIPVVGFQAGGISEMVRQGFNGLLVPVGDVVALRAAIIELLEDPERTKEMAANCRSLVEEKYSLEVMAQNFIKLYHRILGERS